MLCGLVTATSSARAQQWQATADSTRTQGLMGVGRGTSGGSSANSPSQSTSKGYVGWVSEGEALRLKACGYLATGTDGGLDKDGFVEWLCTRKARSTGDYRAENEHRGMVGWAFSEETWQRMQPGQLKSAWDLSRRRLSICLQEIQQAQWEMQSARQQYYSTNDPHLRSTYAGKYHEQKRRLNTHAGARQAEVQFQQLIRPNYRVGFPVRI